MTHAVTTNDGASDLHTTLLADDALVANTAIFTTVTFVVTIWTEDALVEQATLFGALCAVVDGFRLGHFAVRPFEDLVRRCKREADDIELYWVCVLFCGDGLHGIFDNAYKLFCDSDLYTRASVPYIM
jgi:hypothetical protein